MMMIKESLLFAKGEMHYAVVHFCGLCKVGLQNRWKSLFYAILATLGCGNVLRGLSNKCLMRGTFRAICVFGVFHVFFEKS